MADLALPVINTTHHVASVAETWELAARIAPLLQRGMVVALHGGLGSGKTTFMQGLARALGLNRTLTSPTFAICVEHQTTHFTLAHMDLYRLTGPDDLLAIGFFEYLEEGAVVAVEWPERAGDLLPADTLHIHLSHGETPEARRIEIQRQ